MHEARRLLKNFVSLFFSNVTGQALYLFGLVHLARVLGPASFGLWNFAQAWLLYLFRAGELGLEVVGVREVAKDHARTGSWISTVVVLRLVLAAVLMTGTVCAVALNIVPPGSGPLILVFALVVLPVALILEWTFEAHQDLFHVNVARIAKGAIFAILVLLFVKDVSGIQHAALSYVISLALPIVYVGIVALKRFGIGPIPDGRRGLVRVFRTALPVGLATILSQYSLFFATMVIGYVLDRDALGYYTAAHRIMVFLWAYTIFSLQRVLLPTLARYFKSSTRAFEEFIDQFFRYAVVIGGALGLLLTGIAGWSIRLLYTSRYEPAVVILQVLGWAFVAASVRSILEIGLLASSNQRRYMISMSIQAGLYTLLVPLSALKWGIQGAAAASLVAEVGTSTYLVSWWRTGYRMKFTPLTRALAAAAVPLAMLVVFPGWSWALSAPSLAVYAFTVWRMGLITMSDLRAMRAMISVRPDAISELSS